MCELLNFLCVCDDQILIQALRERPHQAVHMPSASSPQVIHKKLFEESRGNGRIFQLGKMRLKPKEDATFHHSNEKECLIGE